MERKRSGGKKLAYDAKIQKGEWVTCENREVS
jgi:hypothetical protein